MTNKNTPTTPDENAKAPLATTPLDQKSASDVAETNVESNTETNTETNAEKKQEKASANTSTKTGAKTKPKSAAAQDRTQGQTTPTSMSKTPISKTAVFALLCAFIAIGGLVAAYFWQQQLHNALINNLAERNALQLVENEQQIQQLLTLKEQSMLAKAQAKANELANNAAANSVAPVQIQLDELKAITASLQQIESTSWQVKEAEYLIRVAARTMWLEKDAASAIALLKDADARLKELNNPAYLDVRQIINQDIEGLQLLPELATEDVILKLMALSSKINDLPISLAHLPDDTETEVSTELSDSTDDWQENLAKTWRKFLADFITVKRRTGNVEALLTPNAQQNLRQNLQLKLQLAQWAATKHNRDLYLASLTAVQNWLNEYFDLASPATGQFIQAIEQLKTEIVALSLPRELASLKAINLVIKQRVKQQEQPQALPDTNLPREQLPSELLPSEKQPKVNTEAESDSGVI
ncbi:uroporphyrinogen-III C-methyltransferase [Colwellia sp. MEBiC06753]